jgi:hypothetical protein
MLNESKMSELHMDISDGLDRHIQSHKAGHMGADTLGDHTVRFAKKLAKQHGIEHKDAQHLVNSYVDGELNEEVLDESRYPSGPHGDEMSADSREAYKTFNSILKSKGFSNK